jgi:hypothetical protein
MCGLLTRGVILGHRRRAEDDGQVGGRDPADPAADALREQGVQGLGGQGGQGTPFVASEFARLWGMTTVSSR